MKKTAMLAELLANPKVSAKDCKVFEALTKIEDNEKILEEVFNVMMRG